MKPAAPPRPNLLVLLPDQLRRAATGFAREDPVRTPRLDRLAAEGLVLDRAYSSHPVCSPARAMLLSGRYPFSTGVLTNCNSATSALGVYLKDDERCLTDVLAAQGYDVGWIGKWHLDRPRAPYAAPPIAYDGNVWDAYTPPGPGRHGIDFWYAYGCSNEHERQRYWVGDAPQSEPTFADEWSPDHEASVALRFLRDAAHDAARNGRPFALFVAMNPPHPPHDRVPQELLEPWRRRAPEELLVRANVDLQGSAPGTQEARRVAAAYFAAVEGVDRAIGRILDGLDELGLSENTLVAFTSDHGEMLGSHGLMQKGLWWEESIGVPCALRWPGRVPVGRSDVLFGSADFFPTVAGLLGIAEHTPAGVEGRDVSAALLGVAGAPRPDSLLILNPAPAVRDLLARPASYPADSLAMLAKHHDLRRLSDPAALFRFGFRGVVTPDGTYAVHRRPDGSEERHLFDHVRDPAQLVDLAATEPEREQRAREALARQLTATEDPWAADFLQRASRQTGRA